jgi:hypothetical protein
MTTPPLEPHEVDALLRPDPRTMTADLLVLRDALQRMGNAFERLAAAVVDLQRLAAEAEQLDRRRDAEIPRPPGLPPRVD